MKKMISKKRILFICLISILFSLLFVPNVCAKNISDGIGKIEYSDDFKNYLNLSDEEKKNTVQPRSFNVLDSKAVVKNPLRYLRMVRSTLESSYSLKDTIPNNVVVKDQKQTNSCWAFAVMSSLETNIALQNKSALKVYDFSERHMEYATSKDFLNNVVNEKGFDKNVGDGGTFAVAETYLTNGQGAINESDMPFEDNEDKIDISKIQNKTVTSEVYDTIDFPECSVKDDLTQIKQKMKDSIKANGSISAYIHGSQLFTEYYNNTTGALYCDDEQKCPINHGVSIIGWNDNYAVSNFAEAHRPQNPGAWIIKNSWGTKLEYSVLEMKQTIFNTYRDVCIEHGWTEASLIPDSYITSIGYTISGDTASINVGDNGFMYVSYEDVNIYKNLFAISKAANSVDYKNIYQYDKYGTNGSVPITQSKIYLGNKFTKNTTDDEYLSQVSLNVPETCTCKVLVNVNGDDMAPANLKEVELKAGQSETFDAGYHTLEFANPIKIESNNFAVVIEIEGKRQNALSISAEANIPDSIYDKVQIANQKCFLTYGNYYTNNDWIDLSKLAIDIFEGTNINSTIKAFTVKEVEDNSLKNIQITSAPTKVTYIEGQNFDKTGMVVKANYNNGQSNVITDYNITNGTNLAYGQASVTINYEGKSITQAITVEKNTVQSIRISTVPTKVQYKAGDNFDKTGMVITAKYKDGSENLITDYTISNGTNLQNGQSSVTVSYQGQSVNQLINVQVNEVTKIEITTQPAKVNYVAGQDFDKTGMIVKATYEDSSVKEITSYTITNGTNLSKDQTYVTISFENKSVNQVISVVEKTISSVQINTMPTKTKYVQGEDDLDLTGGNLKVMYNDGSSDIVSLTSSGVSTEGFDNTVLGNQSVTIKYQEKTTLFQVEIVKKEVSDNPNIDTDVNPVNSNLDDAQCNVKNVKSYTYTKNEKDDYVIFDIQIGNIERNVNNDSCEYFYYLSDSQDEDNIESWIQIKEIQDLNDKLYFTINTKDVNNYDVLSKSDTLYLYVKEVAKKGGNQQVKISKAMEVDSKKANLETYVDDQKKDIDLNINNDNVDNTTAPGVLPQTGAKATIMVCIVVCIIGSAIIFIKRKNLNKKYTRKF